MNDGRILCAENEGTKPNEISNALMTLKGIANRQIGVINLDHTLDIDEVYTITSLFSCIDVYVLLICNNEPIKATNTILTSTILTVSSINVNPFLFFIILTYYSIIIQL